MRSPLRFGFAMPSYIVFVLTFFLFFPRVKADYFIQSISIGESLCNTDLVAGTMISIAWAIENISGTGNDTCWLAIRPTWNTADDNAYVNGVHVRCSFSSTNINIPLKPFDESLPYNGSSYSVRLIFPAPDNVMLDSCSFRIQEQGWQPPMSESDKLAKAANKTSQNNMIIAIVDLVVAIIAAFIAALFPHRLQRRDQLRQIPMAQRLEA